MLLQHSLKTSTSNPGFTFQDNGGNNGSMAAVSGTEQIHARFLCSFLPASGSSPFCGLEVKPTINQTSTASGSYTALRVNVVETALLGSSNKLLDLQAGASGGTSKFSVDNSGNAKGASFIPTVAAPGSAGFGLYGAGQNLSLVGNTNSTAVLIVYGGGGATPVWELGYTGSNYAAMNISTGIVGWSSSTNPNATLIDTGISRLGAASLAIGNGGAGDTTGNLSLNNIIKYGGVATVAAGVPSEMAQLNLTAQAASIGSTTLYAVPASGAGFLPRVCIHRHHTGCILYFYHAIRDYRVEG